MNPDSQKKQKSESKPDVPIKDKDAKSPVKHSVFTLNDGLKLLQLSSKKLLKADSIKIQNLKVYSSEKQEGQKNYLNQEKNILSINPIKGKSIFNNCILDNVLGTINPNGEPIAGKNKFYERNETSFDNNRISNDFDMSSGIPKSNVKESKQVISKFKTEKKLDDKKYSKIEKFENVSEDKLSNSNDKKIKQKENKDPHLIQNKNAFECLKDRKENLFKLQTERNGMKNINCDNELRFIFDLSKSSKNEKRIVSFINKGIKNNDENYFGENKDSKNFKRTMTTNNYLDKYKSNSTNYEFSANKKFNYNNEVNYESSTSRKKLKKDLHNDFKADQLSTPDNCKKENNEAYFSKTPLDCIKIPALMHSKELKFELYKSNKLLEPSKYQKNNNSDGNNLFDSNSSVKNSSKLGPAKKNSQQNLHKSSDALNFKIEASTQTRNNFAAGINEKNSTIKQSDKESLLSCASNENSSKNIPKENAENLHEIKLIKENANKENTINTHNINDDKNFQENLVSESNRKSDFTGDCFIPRNESEKRSNNGISSSTRFKQNSFNEAEKNCLLNEIRRSNFFSPVHQKEYHLDNHNNTENKDINNIGNNNLKFNVVKSTSLNCRLNKKFNLIDFNKELFYNSKILGENLINSHKSKKKSPTSQLSENPENPNASRNLRIKFSNKIKM